MKIYTAHDLLKPVIDQIEAGYYQSGFACSPVEFTEVSQNLVRAIARIAVSSDMTSLQCDDASIKSAFINTVIESQLPKKASSIFYITIENPEDVIYRIFSSITNIREDDLRMGNISEKGWVNLTLAVFSLTEVQFCIINPLGSNFDWLLSTIKTIGRHKKGVVILENTNKIHDEDGISFKSYKSLSECYLPLIMTGQNPLMIENDVKHCTENNHTFSQLAKALLKIGRVEGHKEKVKLGFFHKELKHSIVLELNYMDDAKKYQDNYDMAKVSQI